MLATEATPVTRNLIVDYYDVIMAALPRSGAVAGGPAGAPDFAPGFRLPELAPRAREFFGPATATRRGLGELGGHRLQLMDLTGNPATHKLPRRSRRCSRWPGRSSTSGIPDRRSRLSRRSRPTRALRCATPCAGLSRQAWSLVMVMTGVLTAIDRCLVPAGHEIVVHGSGCYRADDFAGNPPDAEVSTVAEAAAAVLGV